MHLKLPDLFGRILSLRKRGDDMPRKSHGRRRKRTGQVAETIIEPVLKARPMWRVSVKLGQAWSIAYEGSDLRWVDEIRAKYQDRRVVVERI